MVSALAAAAYIEDTDADGDEAEYGKVTNKTRLSTTSTTPPHANRGLIERQIFHLHLILPPTLLPHIIYSPPDNRLRGGSISSTSTDGNAANPQLSGSSTSTGSDGMSTTMPTISNVTVASSHSAIISSSNLYEYPRLLGLHTCLARLPVLY